MALRLVTVDERLAEANNKVTMCIFGSAGIGKTSLLYTLPPEDTLCLDLEAGMKSVQGWRGASIPIRSWDDFQYATALFAGVDPARLPHEPFSQAHYDFAFKEFGSMIEPNKYKTLFIDSITDLSRIVMTWAQTQPAAFSEKTGKPDIRGAYGLLGREVVRVLKHVQHAPGKNVIFVGGLECHTDDFNREIWSPQTEGSKIGLEIPFIVDQVVSMSAFDYNETGWMHNPGKGEYRAFVCKSPNPWGLPAKDRSGNLDLIEEPHLGKLIEKINRAPPLPSERLKTNMPQVSVEATPETAVA